MSTDDTPSQASEPTAAATVSKVRHIVVSAAEAGQKLMQFLRRRLGKEIPQSAIMRIIRTGQVRVDGARAKPFDLLAEGQTVRVPPVASPAERAEAKGGPGLAVIHEDSQLIVLFKPAGLPAQPGSQWADSVQTRIAARFAGADFVPNIAHRLDRATSGLIVAGKTYASLRELNDLFASGGADKTYLAWVAGEWPERGRTLLTDRLAKVGRARREAMETVEEEPEAAEPGAKGKLALAYMTPLTVRDGRTLLAVELLTGRTHQIRVQLASRGFPIVGDRKYGRPPFPERMYLHAWRIVLGERIFSAAPDWEGAFSVEGVELPAPRPKSPAAKEALAAAKPKAKGPAKPKSAPVSDWDDEDDDFGPEPVHPLAAPAPGKAPAKKAPAKKAPPKAGASAKAAVKTERPQGKPMGKGESSRGGKRDQGEGKKPAPRGGRSEGREGRGGRKSERDKPDSRGRGRQGDGKGRSAPASRTPRAKAGKKPR